MVWRRRSFHRAIVRMTSGNLIPGADSTDVRTNDRATFPNDRTKRIRQSSDVLFWCSRRSERIVHPEWFDILTVPFQMRFPCVNGRVAFVIRLKLAVYRGAPLAYPIAAAPDFGRFSAFTKFFHGVLLVGSGHCSGNPPMGMTVKIRRPRADDQ